MITIKSPREIAIMARAGRIVAETLLLLRAQVRPGMSTEDMDQIAEEFIQRHPGATPSFKGLYGFPKTLCTSINEEIVHGIPSPARVLREGNIVSVDVGVYLEGLHADSATTIAVGEVSPEAARLLEVTEQCLEAGVARLVGTRRELILKEALALLQAEPLDREGRSKPRNPYGDGRAGERIADIIAHSLTGTPRQTKDWDGA